MIMGESEGSGGVAGIWRERRCKIGDTREMDLNCLALLSDSKCSPDRL